MSLKAIMVEKVKDFFQKGEIIFKEGEEGNEMYILQSGKVEVVKQTGDEEVVLATLEPKAFFGEMSLFGEPKRSATIRTVEDTQMIVINKRMLDSQLEKVPEWFVTILKTLVERLRETNRAVKSRFKISFEFSVLDILYLMTKKLKGKTEAGYLLALGKTREECANILGITQAEFMERLKNLAFVGLLKYSDPKDQILIPDSQKVQNFLLFLRNKATPGEDGSTTTILDPATNEYFEKIYKLLFRRKL